MIIYLVICYLSFPFIFRAGNCLFDNKKITKDTRDAAHIMWIFSPIFSPLLLVLLLFGGCLRIVDMIIGYQENE